MAVVNALICIDVAVPSGSAIADCPVASQQWQELQLTSDTFIQEALYTVDTDTVSAIFGGALLLFVTGMGFGWIVKILKMAR